jgi:hypothetical protein
MRVVVTGGRDFADTALVDRALSAVHRKHGISTLIEGEARGADRLCAQWAVRLDIPVARFPADWDTHGKRAGHLRNQQMIDEGKPNAAVAFPGGRGTADMVRRLHSAGIPVWDLAA